MATAKERMRIRRNQPTVSRCSFCGKGSDEVRHLIAGPGGRVYLRRVHRALPTTDRRRGDTGGRTAPRDTSGMLKRPHLRDTPRLSVANEKICVVSVNR